MHGKKKRRDFDKQRFISRKHGKCNKILLQFFGRVFEFNLELCFHLHWNTEIFCHERLNEMLGSISLLTRDKWSQLHFRQGGLIAGNGSCQWFTKWYLYSKPFFLHLRFLRAFLTQRKHLSQQNLQLCATPVLQLQYLQETISNRIQCAVTEENQMDTKSSVWQTTVGSPRQGHFI